MKKKFTDEEIKKIWQYYSDFATNTALFPLLKIKRHRTSNSFTHVCNVTRNAIEYAIKHSLDIDYFSLIRGGFLHDYYFYDWRDNKKLLWGHGRKHPLIALQNAIRDFNINDKEKDIIKNHMWPLGLFRFPKSKEARIISYMDKKSATVDALSLRHKAIIFDFDGTLFDTVTDVTNSLNLAFKENGIKPITVEQMKPRMGYVMVDTIKYFLGEDASEELVNKVIKDYRKYYDDHFATNVQPYEDIKETLIRLKARGYRLGVSTNKKEEAAKFILDKFFPNLIDCVQGDDGKIPLKPNPTCIKRVKKRLRSRKIVYVGDTEIDYQTARNAKAPVIIATYGYRDKKDLAKLDAIKIDKPSELLIYLK